MGDNLRVAVLLPHYSATPTPHAARMNDALACLEKVAPFIELDVVSVSALGRGSLFSRVTRLLSRVKVAAAGADVVHLGAYLPLYPLIWMLIRNKPVVLGPNITGSSFPRAFLGTHALNALTIEKPFHWIQWYLGGGALREQIYVRLGKRADKVITLSNYAADIIASRGMPRELMDVMPLAAPLVAYESIAPLPKQDGRRKPCIAYVGRLDRRKGFDLFLSVVEKFEGDICFLVVGDGIMRPQLEQAARNDPRILIMGHLERVRVLDLLQHVDIYFQPSTYEAVATSVLEALRSGVPVVSANLPAHCEVAKLGGVYLFPSGSAELGKETLAEVLNNIADVRSLATKASNQLNVEDAARWLASLYSQLGGREHST